MIFENRSDAAMKLAKTMKTQSFLDPIVLGIPRGGIVTAAVLAKELNADFDVVLSRKIGAPNQQEFALGAISEDGQVFLNPALRESQHRFWDCYWQPQPQYKKDHRSCPSAGRWRCRGQAAGSEKAQSAIGLGW